MIAKIIFVATLAVVCSTVNAQEKMLRNINAVIPQKLNLSTDSAIKRVNLIEHRYDEAVAKLRSEKSLNTESIKRSAAGLDRIRRLQLGRFFSPGELEAYFLQNRKSWKNENSKEKYPYNSNFANNGVNFRRDSVNAIILSAENQIELVKKKSMPQSEKQVELQKLEQLRNQKIASFLSVNEKPAAYRKVQKTLQKP